WSKVFSTLKSIVNKVVHRFVGYPEKTTDELIWKPRCKATIAQERELEISTKQKKVKYTGPHGDYSDGKCPGSSLDPHAADRKLLESYQAVTINHDPKFLPALYQQVQNLVTAVDKPYHETMEAEEPSHPQVIERRQLLGRFLGGLPAVDNQIGGNQSWTRP
ncbi:hypothetical protein BGX27_010213, partial [Mortierella sp. AM989]